MRRNPAAYLIALSFLLPACAPTVDDDDIESGVPFLGSGSHDLDSVQIDVVVDEGLDVPRDLEFHPQRAGELWVVNRGDESVTAILDAGTDDQEVMHFRDGQSGPHFLGQPSALAFADDGTFSTSHETDVPTQGPPAQGGSPADFMGPTWWSSDLDVFNAGHASHLDMLHASPNGMGIAWETDSVWWYFDGAHGGVARYDFNEDHGLGGAFHGDGEMQLFIEGELDRQPDIPSHMVYDHETDWLYIADTGNDRIIALDATSGTPGLAIDPNYDGGLQYEMRDGVYEVIVDDQQVSFGWVSGIALHDGLLYVSDSKTSTLLAFSLDGELVDWIVLDLPEGALMGIEFDDDGNLWAVDAVNDEILRVSAPTDNG